jgi:predicted MFS family arabinose efflux permease
VTYSPSAVSYSLHHSDTRRFSLFFAIVYFAQGLADLSAGLVNQPAQYLLKEQLGLTAAESGMFWAIVGLGWTCKPLYGLLSDFIPFAGYHRKSYLLFMSGLGMSGWLTLSLLSPHYVFLLAIFTLCATTLAFCDVMTDALMVEAGRPRGLTGQFQAVQWAAMSLALVLAQLGGGYLSMYATPHFVFLLVALFPTLTCLVTLWLVHEPPAARTRREMHATALSLKRVGQSRTLWMVAGFLFFWNFSPSFGTPLLYYQTDVLHFSKVYIGSLGAIANAAGIVGAAVFFLYCRRLPLRRLLAIAIGLGVLATLGYLGLVGPRSALVISLFFGVINQFTHLAVLDLAARTCPARAEGTVFALLMATLNFGKTGGTALGGWLYDHSGFSFLIIISAGFTACCWGLLPFLDEKTSEECNYVTATPR